MKNDRWVKQQKKRNQRRFRGGRTSTDFRSAGTCSTCGKQIYPDRKAARKAASIFHPGAPLHAYECDTKGRWHYGHLPDEVVEGERTRDSITHRRLKSVPVDVPEREPRTFTPVSPPARIPSPAELAQRAQRKSA